MSGSCSPTSEADEDDRGESDDECKICHGELTVEGRQLDVDDFEIVPCECVADDHRDDADCRGDYLNDCAKDERNLAHFHDSIL